LVGKLHEEFLSTTGNGCPGSRRESFLRDAQKGFRIIIIGGKSKDLSSEVEYPLPVILIGFLLNLI
jgi:hypothetical protein